MPEVAPGGEQPSEPRTDTKPAATRNGVVGWLFGRLQSLTHDQGWWPKTLNDQLEAALKLTLIVGAIVAVMEYRDQRADVQVDRTFDFNARYDSPEFRLVRARIRQAIAQSIAAASTPDPASEPIDPSLYAAYQSFEGAGIMEEVAEVTSFLNSLEVCVAERLCDDATAVQLFGPFAVRFWENFEPVVTDQRQRDRQGFAENAEAFVTRAKAEPADKPKP